MEILHNYQEDRTVLQIFQHKSRTSNKLRFKLSQLMTEAPMAKRLFEIYGKDAFASMSFDKGFTRTADREELEQNVPLVVMPKKGKLSLKDKERESTRQFVQFKNRHSAIESDINSLEHHGLNRCRDKGLNGFKRSVGFGILAYNLHRIGARLLAKKSAQSAQKERFKEAA